MRILLAALACGVLSTVPAHAKIDITVDKDTQTMTVVQDGVEKYRWPVSSGLPSYETPNGAFKAFRMEAEHYSKEYDDAAMPHSIFFTKRGHAIHGTDWTKRLGNPASHGCVRLSRQNAATLFAMVKADGVLNTTVTLSGSSQVAIASKRGRNPSSVARLNAAPDYVDVEQMPARRPRAEVVYGYADDLGYGGRPYVAPRTVYRQVYGDDYMSVPRINVGPPRGYYQGY